MKRLFPFLQSCVYGKRPHQDTFQVITTLLKRAGCAISDAHPVFIVYYRSMDNKHEA